jgi:hypothetical protein
MGNEQSSVADRLPTYEAGGDISSTAAHLVFTKNSIVVATVPLNDYDDDLMAQLALYPSIGYRGSVKAPSICLTFDAPPPRYSETA